MSSLAPPIICVAKNWQLKDRRFPIDPDHLLRRLDEFILVRVRRGVGRRQRRESRHPTAASSTTAATTTTTTTEATSQVFTLLLLT